MPAPEEDDDPAQSRAIEQWIRSVLGRCGIVTIKMRASDGGDPVLGLVGVPQKYATAIDALCQGIHAAARGEELPELVPAPAPKKRSRR